MALLLSVTGILTLAITVMWLGQGSAFHSWLYVPLLGSLRFVPLFLLSCLL